MKGKGLLSDIASDAYTLGAKILTGSQPSKYNKFAQPKLNPNFGIKDLRPVTFDMTSGPGTNIAKQIPKVMALGKNIQPITAISATHDLAYEKIYKGDKNAKKKIRQADDNMLNQIGKSMGKEATISNFVHHPWKTTADLFNDGVAYLGIKTKQIAENIGLPSYGANDRKISNAKKKLYTKTQQQLQNYLNK